MPVCHLAFYLFSAALCFVLFLALGQCRSLIFHCSSFMGQLNALCLVINGAPSALALCLSGVVGAQVCSLNSVIGCSSFQLFLKGQSLALAQEWNSGLITFLLLVTIIRGWIINWKSCPFQFTKTSAWTAAHSPWLITFRQIPDAIVWCSLFSRRCSSKCQFSLALSHCGWNSRFA